MSDNSEQPARRGKTLRNMLHSRPIIQPQRISALATTFQ